MIFRNFFSRIKLLFIKLLVYFLPNPASAPAGQPIVTRKEISRIFVRLSIFLGLGCFTDLMIIVLINLGLLKGVSLNSVFQIRVNTSDYDRQSFNIISTILGILATMYYAIMPFLRYIYKWLKVTGPIYAFCVGFLYSFSMRAAKSHQLFLLLASFVISAALTMIPIYLLYTKNVKPPKQMARITYIAFAVITLGGSVIKILNQIPYLYIMCGYMIDLAKYTWVQILLDFINTVIAFLFISLAFERIRDYVRKGVNRKYGWLGAFTGFYTVTIIIGRVGDILKLIA